MISIVSSSLVKKQARAKLILCFSVTSCSTLSLSSLFACIDREAGQAFCGSFISITKMEISQDSILTLKIRYA